MGHRGEKETSFDDGERSNHFCGYQNLHQQQVTTNPASKIAERETKAVMLGANPGRTLLFDLDMARQVFWAVHKNEVIPCHLIAKKDRDERGKYAANSKRDKRRFQTAYANPDDAHKAVAQYETYMSQPDTF